MRGEIFVKIGNLRKYIKIIIVLVDDDRGRGGNKINMWFRYIHKRIDHFIGRETI